MSEQSHPCFQQLLRYLFKISLQFCFFLCVYKGCSPTSRLGSWWWLTHILAPCLLWGRGWMNDRKCSFTVFSHFRMCMVSSIKKLVVGVSQDSPQCTCRLMGAAARWRFESATTKRCALTRPHFPIQEKAGNDTQPLCLIIFSFLIPFGFKQNYSI